MTDWNVTKNGNRVTFNSAFEERMGYSRAIRTGDTVYVGGMTATDNSGKIIGDDLYTQMKVTYEKIEAALKAHGAEMRDIVKEVIYLKDFSDPDGLARAHKEVFDAIRPVSTAVVAPMILPEMLVEIEVTAVIGNMSQIYGRPA